MNRLTLRVVVGWVLLGSSVAAGQDLSYTLTPMPYGARPELQVELSFTGEADGETVLKLPSRWAYVTDYEQGLSELKLLTAGASLRRTSPELATVKHAPAQALRIRYTVARYDTGSFALDDRYRPYLDRQSLHLIGYSLWVHPAWDEETPRSIRLEWQGLPAAWQVATSFGVGREPLSLRHNLATLRHALYLAGEIRLHRRLIRGRPLTVALIGQWQFADTALVSRAETIVASQRGFWREWGFAHYLISALPVAVEGHSYSGTALTDAFCLFLPTHTQIPNPYLESLLAHEHFHTWNAERLGHIDEPEARMYWFTEGFTDYYARVLRHRSGLLSDTALAAELNEKIERYWRSPRRTAPRDSVVAGFWRDADLGQLPYWQGELLAWRWATRLSRRGHSLDTLMHALRRRNLPSTQPLDDAVIAGLLSPLLGYDVRAELTRVLDRGEPIEPEPDALGPRFRLDWSEVEVFEVGFDIAHQRAQGEIRGVTPASAAYRAGLRNGMKVIRRPPIYLGKTDQQVEVVVQSPQGPQQITYRPVADAKLRIPHYAPR